MISSQHIARATLALADKHPHSVEKIADDLLVFVQKYKLETQLPAIVAAIERELKIRAQKNTLSIETPFALSHAELAYIKRYVGVAEHTIVDTRENRALIGGFIAHWQDKKIDGSIAHTLDRLRETLAQTV